MKGIYIRNIPDEVYRSFKSAAALHGLTIRDAAIQLYENFGKESDHGEQHNCEPLGTGRR